VPLPSADARAGILQTLARCTPVAADVDVRAVAASARCDGFSGADMAALLREACVQALRSQSAHAAADGGAPLASPRVTREHFDAALQLVMPSVSRADARRYDELRRKLRRSRNQIPDASRPDVAAAAAAAPGGHGEDGDAVLA
jgi:ribosome biogenesis ATPase